MKRIKFLMAGIMMCISTAAFSQTTNKTDSTVFAFSRAKALAVYQQAQKYNDALMTKQALYDLLVLNNTDSTVMRGLAELYYQNGQFTSSALVSLDFLEKYPGNLIATEIVALSYEQLRLYDKAIEYYQPMWLKTENINILYQIAYLQYSLKRYAEANNNLGIVDSKLADDATIQLNTNSGAVQEVKFKAAVLNLRAMIAADQGDKAAAKGFLNQALALSPDFEAAKAQLDELNKG